MSKFTVFGHATIICSMEVDANTEEEAIEIANNTFGGLSNYAGMGGVEHIIGVSTSESDRCIFPDSDPEFDDAIEI